MCVSRVKSDGVRRSRSSVFGVSTMATLIEPPRIDWWALCSERAQPARAAPPIATRSAIQAHGLRSATRLAFPEQAVDRRAREHRLRQEADDGTVVEEFAQVL